MHLFSYVQFAFEALYLHSIRNARIYSVLAVLVFIGIPLWTLFVPARNFPPGALVTIEKDASFSETTFLFAEKNIISSQILFKLLARITGIDRDVRAGRYVFEEPIGTAMVLYRIAHGISGIHSVRVTFPEGITVREMGEILTLHIPGFNTALFVSEARPYEGYLFPDTYDVYVDSTAEEIITRMRARFDSVFSSITTHENSRGDALRVQELKERVVIMVSILEKETKTGPERAEVSGILWERIDIGMALQVDAVFGYIKGIDTYHPSGEDLDIDSLYNTYKYPGLPPRPISNPGKDSLKAAQEPAKTDFLYYLTGNDGVMYYARTFEEHKKNKELYLR